MKRLNPWRLALHALLPALVFGGCDCSGCGGSSQGCGSSSGCGPEPACNLDFSEHCTVAADCTPPFDICQVAACVAQRCTSVSAADGVAPPDKQTAGDCVVATCQGGELVNMPASDPPSIVMGSCQIGTCDDGSPTFVNASDGTTCTQPSAGASACVGGACLRLPDDVPGSGGGGTGGGGTGGGGTGGGGTGGADAGADAGGEDGGDGGSTDGGSDGGDDAGPPPGCVHCFEVLYGAPASELCPASKTIYTDLTSCICGPTCATACGANLCQHEPADTDCNDCIASIASGCGSELTTCNQDP